jgi:hypothetical protein
MRYFVAALGLMVALTFGHVASATGNTGWENSSNGDGAYHLSNGWAKSLNCAAPNRAAQRLQVPAINSLTVIAAATPWLAWVGRCCDGEPIWASKAQAEGE